ncbi:hypothetical protein GGI11_007154 [Coemansia sp. RSA 2049]|nr:hypothetical protein GGI11_007154 [Coemansia sp. RSA 2049]
MAGGLEEATQKRKARLQALREARQATTTAKSKEPTELKDTDTPGTTEPDKSHPSAPEQHTGHERTVERLVDGMVETTLAERQESMATTDLVDITAIAPRRANWDLKRELHKRLDALKPRNDAAIADLIRKRIQDSGDASDIADAVEANARSSAAQEK